MLRIIKGARLIAEQVFNLFLITNLSTGKAKSYKIAIFTNL